MWMVKGKLYLVKVLVFITAILAAILGEVVQDVRLYPLPKVTLVALHTIVNGTQEVKVGQLSL